MRRTRRLAACRTQAQVSFAKIKEVRAAPRAFGAWGDMVIFLKDGSQVRPREVQRAGAGALLLLPSPPPSLTPPGAAALQIELLGMQDYAAIKAHIEKSIYTIRG